MNFNTDEEEWEVVSGYNGRYSVSSYGRVYNNERERYLKPSTSSALPYPRVNLTKGNKPKTLYVHRLVGLAFIPNILNLETINHIDEDKCNNHVSNLEWLSFIDNQNHGTRNERVIANNDIFDGIKVIGKSICGTNTIQLESMSQGKECGFDGSTISKCCSGKLRTHGGYTWKKVESNV